MIYDPAVVTAVFQAMDAAALVMFGAWLQRPSPNVPKALQEHLGNIGAILHRIGEARQQINAGLATNDVPDELVWAQKAWNKIAMWREDPYSVPLSLVIDAADELSAALTYLDQRTMETGTDHPRWNALLVAGQHCDCCGRN
jgi:hypothetical protein